MSHLEIPESLLEHLSDQFHETAKDFGLGTSKLAEIEEGVKKAKKKEIKATKKEKTADTKCGESQKKCNKAVKSKVLKRKKGRNTVKKKEKT